MKENKKANFWIKLLAKLIDLLPVTAFSIGILFSMMSHSSGKWVFNEVWMYYVWNIVLITLIALMFLVIPLITKGKTLGMWITRIKIVADKDLRKRILKREIFFAWTWIFMAILVLSVINHTLIYKFASTKNNKENLTSWENLRIGIASGIGSISIIIQMFLGISGVVRSDKRALHDVYAETNVVWINKFIVVEKPKVLKSNSRKLRPVSYREEKIEWEE